jgi:hypothetical protein
VPTIKESVMMMRKIFPLALWFIMYFGKERKKLARKTPTTTMASLLQVQPCPLSASRCSFVHRERWRFCLTCHCTCSINPFSSLPPLSLPKAWRDEVLQLQRSPPPSTLTIGPHTAPASTTSPPK